MLQLTSLGLIVLIMSGCASSIATYEERYLVECKETIKPKWLSDEYVGVSRITASSDKTEQKKIAIQRAIATLLMTKGTSKGDSTISVQREVKTANQQELYTKSFKENSSIQVKFKDIDYDVKITNIWEDPCTKEIYIKIKEK